MTMQEMGYEFRDARYPESRIPYRIPHIAVTTERSE